MSFVVRCALVIVAGFAAQSFQSIAFANSNCDQEFAQSKLIADAVSISGVSANAIRAGDSIKITWRSAAELTPTFPIYVVTTSPVETRFRGKGFIALTGGATAPRQIAFGVGKSRTFTALHWRTDANSPGTIEILPQLVGQAEIQTAIIYAGNCGERVLKQSRHSVVVRAGKATIVAQDRFSNETPSQIIKANSGKHYIKVFDSRYEVYDAATDDLLIRRSGKEPNFSPTSRFIAALKTDGTHAYDVFDLLSAERSSLQLLDRMGDNAPPRSLLVWTHHDSFLVSDGGGFWSPVQVQNLIVDTNAVFGGNAEDSCRACTPWDDSQIILDVDRGFVARLSDGLLGEGQGSFRDLFERSETKFVSKAESLSLVQANYDADYKEFPKRWDVGGPLRLSHNPKHEFSKTEIPDATKRKDANRDFVASQRFVVSHASLVSKKRNNGSLSRQSELKHRSGREIVVSESKQEALGTVGERLSAIGIDTLSTVPSKLVHLSDYDGRTFAQNQKSYSDAIAPISWKVRLSQKERESLENCGFDNPDSLFDGAAIPDRLPDQVYRWTQKDNEYWLVSVGCDVAKGLTIVRNFLLKAAEGQFDLIELESFGGVGETKIALYLPNENTIAIGSPIEGVLSLVDLDGKKLTSDSIRLQDMPLVTELRIMPDKGSLLQTNSDGRFFVIRLSDQKKLLEGIYADDEVVVTDENGFYDATFEGAQLANVRLQGMPGLHRFSQFEAALYRPGLVKTVLAQEQDAVKSNQNWGADHRWYGQAAPKETSPPQMSSPPAVVAPPRVTLRLDSTKPTNGAWKAKAVLGAEQAVKEVRVLVDGRLTKIVPVPPRTTTLDLSIPDAGAGRWVALVAVGESNLVSLPSAIQLPGKPEPKGALRAVLVGIDNYQDQDLRLNQAKYDANNLSRALAALRGKAFSSVQTELILDADAKRANVLAKLAEAASQTGPNDRLVVYFAGHGLDARDAGEGAAGLFLASHETDKSDIRRTAIAWNDIAEALSVAKGIVAVILDACHSGFAAKSDTFSNDGAASALLTKAGGSMVILAASKGRQFSLESPVRGGQFTNALVAAIMPKPGAYRPLSLSELYSKVKLQVMKATDGKQTPWLVRNGLAGEMTIF